jgi:hypothetical protein
MIDPFTASIAAALAAGATAAATDGSKALITKTATLVRERFRRSPADQATLEEARRQPDDQTMVERLAQLLDQRMREDPEFAERLMTLWKGIETGGSSGHNQVFNSVSGSVQGPVIQARDVHGGITLNTSGQHRPTED